MRLIGGMGRGIYAVQLGSYIGDPIALSLGVASASVELESRTVYRLWSSVDAFFLLGPPGTIATLASHPIKAGLSEALITQLAKSTLAAIVASGTGKLFISEIDVEGP